VAIHGAGLVGCYLGGRLHGHASVRLICRPYMITALNEHGLGTSDFRGHHRHVAVDSLDMRTHASAAIDAELVLVTVKSAATAEVAEKLAGVLAPGAVVVSFQNGLRNVQRLREALPAHTVLAGMVPFNVVQTAPGTFHQASSGQLMVEDSPALASFLDAFAAAGLPLQPRRDMPAVQWAKLLLNLNNALNALSGLPLRQQLSQRAWRGCLALAMREALLVLRHAGIQPARLTPLPAAWLPRVLQLPDALFRHLAAAMLAIDPAARSSTWEDLRAGRPTEVDAINGEVVALARACDLQAPVNARLVERVHEAEHRPRSWRGADLLAELLAAR
jgi:2-dehydropantoate 2-reductase